MIDMIKGIVAKYFMSFDNTEEGYSRKKLLATFLIINGVLIEWWFPNAPMTNTYAMLNFGTGLSLLGLGAYQKIQTDKINNSNNSKTEDSK